MTCSGKNCSKEQIVNVKYNLCENCNSIRITGKSLFERRSESAKKFQGKQISNVTKEKKDRGLFVRSIVTPVSVKVFKPIKQQTAKEAGIKTKLSALKNDIRLDAVQNNEYFCKGCGCTGSLDCSHILSVGKFKHLELVKENIQLLCRVCHLLWESGAIDQQMNLNCFNDNLAFIATQDQESYQKFKTRIDSYTSIKLNFT